MPCLTASPLGASNNFTLLRASDEVLSCATLACREKAPLEYDPTCCCSLGCCCCPLAAGDEAADATPRAEPSPYRLIRLGPVHLGFNAHYVGRYGIAWGRELIPSPWCDVDEALSSDDEVSSEEDEVSSEEDEVSSEEDEVSSEEDEVSSSDDGAQEDVPVDDKRSEADIEDNDDDDVFEDAGAVEESDAGEDGSDGGVECEDEDKLEYAD